MLTNLYAVMFGGLLDDFGLAINVDAAGNAYVAGQTLSGEFPVLDALQPDLVGRSDGFLAKIQFADALAAVTIDTVPPNLLVVVDGATNNAPITTNWVFGSGHRLTTIPTQNGPAGTRFVWTSWSNGGLISNQVFPFSATTNCTAGFTTQFFLTMDAAPGGGVNPGSSWYDAGTVVPITATPAFGASFAAWTGAGTGAFTGTNNPASVTMDGPITETADFAGAAQSRLEVVVNGQGTVSPNLNGQSLAIGKTYSISASPAPGFLFAGWSGDVTNSRPALSFVMTNGLVLEANFVPNPFLPAKGSYAGLFFDTNNLEFQSSGFASATVNQDGSFSATVRPGGIAYSIGGQFTTNGQFYGTIPRSSLLTRLQVRLQLDLAATNRLTGQVSDGTWTADILANRAVFSTANPAPQRGKKYILRLPGSANSMAAPGGDSFGSVSVDSLGNLQFTGTLADGTRATQSTFVSGSGQWPLFAWLGSARGILLGWVSFTGTNLAALSGPVTWFRPPLPRAHWLYPGGFTFQTDSIGSAYAFTNGTRALNFSQGVVVLENGGLFQNLTNQVLLGPDNRVTVLTGTNRLSLTLSPATGLFQGSFLHPLTLQSVAFSGALLPSLTNGTGFFVITNQSGRVFFGP